MFKNYYDISKSKQSAESNVELKRKARDSYLAEKNRHIEGQALLNSFDFDAIITVWDYKTELTIELPDKRILYENTLELTEKEEKQLNNWKLQAIYDQGGALNWPGFYYPNQQILNFVKRKLRKKRNK